jgi:uncharacterized protein (DUF934 family)
MQTTTIDPPGWLIFDGDASRIPAGADVLIPLDEWRERAAVWRHRARRLGVLLSPGDDPCWLAADEDRLALVAVGCVRIGHGDRRASLEIVPLRIEPPQAGRSLAQRLSQCG